MRTLKLLVLAPFAIVAACGGDKPTPPVTPPTSMDTPDAGGMPSDMPASSGTAAMPSSSAAPVTSASAVPSTTSSAMMAAPDAGPADAGKAPKKDDKKPAGKK
jgi:hypothetical protein